MEKGDRPELSLDRPSEQGFITFFKGLPPKPDETIRLFERGDYYSVHGDDALFVAQTVYKTSTVIKYLGGEGPKALPSCTLSKLNTNAFLRDLLLVRLYRVEIWGMEGRQWRIVKHASPGNLVSVEDMLFTSNEVSSSPVVLALKVMMKADQQLVGVAYTDATTMRTIGVSEFTDNDTYSNLESLLVQLSVKECVIPTELQNFELKRIEEVLERCGVVVTQVKKGDFQLKDIEQDLNRLLDEEVPLLSLPEYELKTAMCCVASLIKYLGLLTDESNFHQYTLTNYDFSHYMRLDAAAVRALNLFPGPQDGSNKSMSLYGLLNKCKTAQGARLMAQWLKQPSMSLPDIQTRHDIVEAMVNDNDLRQSLQDEHLKNFPDLHRLAKRFQKGNAQLQDVVRVYQVVIRLPAWKEALDAYQGEFATLINETYSQKLEEHTAHLAKLQELVETTIDLDAVEHHEFQIKADYDPELQQMKEKMLEISAQFEPEAIRVANDLGLEYEKKLKFEKNAQYGYIMRLTRKDATVLRGQREYIELATRKDGVYFTTSVMRQLNNEHSELSTRYAQVQSSLVKDVIEITSSYFPVLEQLNQLVAHLDVLVSFAHVSMHAPEPYVRPKLTQRGEGGVKLTGARHPCLEMQDIAFIDNDVEMEREKSSFQIITGPNMGGKSTYIRQIGMIALMAQAGCFVPCRDAQLCVFDSILARVGAGDSTLKGVSTFMAEMLETAAILRSATKNSLIIIDELGRGTSTYDGFGLAWAISEYIATKIGSFTLFATHFHELTVLADRVPAVTNLHVAALRKDRGITLLYKVRPGPCDQSFGIHVAELANFPEKVVNMAKRKAAELEDFSAPAESTTVSHERPWKSSKTDIEKGNELIEQFLSEVASCSELEGEGSAKILESVKERYKEKFAQSAFVQEVLVDL
ncbi:muts domain V-domain-containing protein [Phlyctochytrium arcticum]|nr:muts domain V-domain-containing protein [Phlyctochytrium arcticum]